MGVGVNGGDEVSVENVNYLYKKIGWVDEVCMGDGVIRDGLYVGLEGRIEEYKKCVG